MQPELFIIDEKRSVSGTLIGSLQGDFQVRLLDSVSDIGPQILNTRIVELDSELSDSDIHQTLKKKIVQHKDGQSFVIIVGKPENTFPAPMSFLHPGESFIIAEIGGNHEGDFEYARKLLADAAESGAHAIKYQIYKGDSIVSKVEGPDRNKHFKKFELSYEQYEQLASEARAAGLQFMSSLWDAEAIDRFDPAIDVHKVGSGDFTNYPLLKRLALTNKPLLLATAMSNLTEVRETVTFIDSVNPDLRAENKLCLMHCVAMYGEPEDRHANLGAIHTLQEEFPDIHIGYSDHTKGTYACELALGMGARVIEVHFTDDKTRKFRDHHLSITKEEMKSLVQRSSQITELFGSIEKVPVSEIETNERIYEFRRAVYPAQDIPAGTVLTEDMLTTLRPNRGIDARKFYGLIGRKLTKSVKAFEALSAEWIK